MVHYYQTVVSKVSQRGYTCSIFPCFIQTIHTQYKHVITFAFDLNLSAFDFASSQDPRSLRLCSHIQSLCDQLEI